MKDNEGRVISYLEWRQVGQSGFDKLMGEFIWINHLWIHEDYSRDWSVMRDLMNEALRMAKEARFIYFTRKKYDGRMSKLYTRDKIMRILEKGLVHGRR